MRRSTVRYVTKNAVAKARWVAAVRSPAMKALIKQEKARREEESGFKLMPVTTPLTVSFTGLNLVLKKDNKKVLSDVFGTIRSFNITALMGPSGAGERLCYYYHRLM